MEIDKADPETQRDVDIMILDYLICIRIRAMLCGRTAKPEDQTQSQDGWAFNSIYHCKCASMAHPMRPCMTEENTSQIYTATRAHPPAGSADQTTAT